MKYTENYSDQIKALRRETDSADAVIIGAGAGLSASAGYVYTGERFDKYFGDFAAKYHFSDMYSGGFYPYHDKETFWSFWSRYIWINRYAPIPNDTYDMLLKLVKDKDYFVLTTNVDHCFQRSGFDKRRLFYTQGDYGLLQSSNPHGASAHKTYENKEIIRKMVLAQGYEIAEDNELLVPENAEIAMRIPTELIPYCPDDGEPMTTNLRADDSFVEDKGWYRAAERYSEFLREHENGKVLFLECAVGMNTPVFYVLNPIQPKMAKNSRFYPENGYFIKELPRITDSERLRRCA